MKTKNLTVLELAELHISTFKNNDVVMVDYEYYNNRTDKWYKGSHAISGSLVDQVENGTIRNVCLH